MSKGRYKIKFIAYSGARAIKINYDKIDFVCQPTHTSGTSQIHASYKERTIPIIATADCQQDGDNIVVAVK